MVWYTASWSASVPRLYSTEPRRNGKRAADDGAFIGSTILGTRRAGRELSAEDQEDPTLLITQRLAHIVRAIQGVCLGVLIPALAFSRPEFTGFADWKQSRAVVLLNLIGSPGTLFKNQARDPNPSLTHASAVPSEARKRTRDHAPAYSNPSP